MMRDKQGFSLIELLVVIAIISLLAGILFPLFAQARAKARQVVCASNLKQIGAAMALYTQDYDEQMPNHDNCALSGRNSNTQVALLAYTKSINVWRCPSDATVNTVFVPTLANPCGLVKTRWSSYAFYAGGAPPDFPNLNGILLSAVPSPSQTIVFLENGETDGRAEGNCDLPLLETQMWNEVGSGACILGAGALQFFRGHSDGFNALYYDGHAKWSKYPVSKSAFLLNP